MKKILLIIGLFSFPALARAGGGGGGVVPGTTSAIAGTATNDNAATGFVGEYISSTTVAASVATSGQFGNRGQISLTAGDWDVAAGCHIVANGATVTIVQGAISINSANTTTDHVLGDNVLNGFIATAVTPSDVSMPDYRLSLSGTTVVYIKIAATYTVAVPTAACRISARRVR